MRASCPSRELTVGFHPLLLLLVALLLSGCGAAAPKEHYLGYMEGDFIQVGADESGRLETLHVEEGQQVTKGELLFALESSREVAARNAAQARLEQAEASLKLARIALERARKLFEQGVVPRSRLDDAQTAFDTNSAAAAAARAQFEDALTRLARRSVAAPVSGKVEQVYYRPGEIVTAGRPVVSLLPPGNLKVKFYVPEPVRPLFATGQLVAFSCDGCPEGLMARVTFVSSEAEYAPPVIFSREERSKLLFMVEARPLEGGSSVPVGQPVTVTLPEQQYPAGS